MKSVALLSQKGGAGKSTLGIHLAVLALQSGMSAILVDTDPQASALKWWERRDPNASVDLPLVARPARDLPGILDAALAESVDRVIVDTAPHADTAATSVARAVDFILIPCRPSSLDLDAIGATVALVKAIRKPAGFVLNSCPAGRGTGEAGLTGEAREALAQHGLPIAPVAITQRVALAHALIDGRAVTEYEPEGKAASELRALWSWVEERI